MNTSESRYDSIEAVLRACLSQDPSRDGRSIGAYIANEGSIVGALLYYSLFFPPLEEIEGLVFQRLAGLPPSSEKASRVVRADLRREKGDTEAVQSLYNHIHPSSLFTTIPDLGRPWTEEDEDALETRVRLLTEAIADTWRLWLHANYPSIEFVVDAYDPRKSADPESDWDVDDFQVTFYQVAH